MPDAVNFLNCCRFSPFLAQPKSTKLDRGRYTPRGVYSISLFASELGVAAIATSLFVATVGMRVYSYFAHKSLSDDIKKAQIKSVSESLQIVLTGKNMGQRTGTPQKLCRDENTARSMFFAKLKNGLLLAYRKEKGVVASSETKKKAEEIAGKILKIRGKIEQLVRGESISSGVEGLRDDLEHVMGNSLYQMIKNQDCEAVNFLQFIAIKLLAADGTDALRNYGKKCLGALEGNAFSTVQLADFMSGYLEKPGFSYGLGWPIWFASHPITAMHSAESTYNPLGYNSAQSNPNFSAHSFSKDGKTMRFYYGPGPTGNPIFEHGVLPMYKKFSVFELRFTHQDTIQKAEYQRVREIQRIGDENSTALRHALIGFDTKIEKNKGVKFEDPDTFFATYRKYIKNGVRGHPTQKDHSGFHIPENLLSDAQVDMAIGKAQEFCRILSRDNPYWKKMMKEQGPKSLDSMSTLKYYWHASMGNQKALHPLEYHGKARMAKMMQLITDTYLMLAIIYRSFDAITPKMVQQILDTKLDNDLTALRISGACKQNIDRGVVENVFLRLFFRWAQNPALLTQEEVYDIAGALLGRARLVDDRKIMANRYQILDDFFRFIGSSPGGIPTVHSLLKE